MSATEPVALRSFLAVQIQMLDRWAGGILGSLKDSDWLARPGGVKNPPHWLAGHLAVSWDLARGLADAEPAVPPEWESLFGEGTQPRQDGAGYPDPASIRETLHGLTERNVAEVGALTDTDLQAPPHGPIPEMAARFLTTRERYLALNTAHFGYHLGQVQLIVRALREPAG